MAVTTPHWIDPPIFLDYIFKMSSSYLHDQVARGTLRVVHLALNQLEADKG